MQRLMGATSTPEVSVICREKLSETLLLATEQAVTPVEYHLQ